MLFVSERIVTAASGQVNIINITLESMVKFLIEGHNTNKIMPTTTAKETYV